MKRSLEIFQAEWNEMQQTGEFKHRCRSFCPDQTPRLRRPRRTRSWPLSLMCIHAIALSSKRPDSTFARFLFPSMIVDTYHVRRQRVQLAIVPLSQLFNTRTGHIAPRGVRKGLDGGSQGLQFKLRLWT